MIFTRKILPITPHLTLALLLFSWGTADLSVAQEFDELALSNQVKRVRIGPHPKYTRILVDLTNPTLYQVKADFPEKKIELIFDGFTLSPGVVSKRYRDKNLEAIRVRSLEGQVILTLLLKSSNTRFFHFQKSATTQVVLDLKGVTKPYLKTNVRDTGEENATKIETIKDKPEVSKTERVVSPAKKQAQEIAQKNTEGKITNGSIELGFQVAKYLLGTILVVLFFPRLIGPITNFFSTRHVAGKVKQALAKPTSANLAPDETQTTLSPTEQDVIEEERNHLDEMREEVDSGLETVRKLEPKAIASFLINEHPQTAAIVMAHLEPTVSSQIIQELPEEVRVEIVHRLAALERVAPDVVRELDETLQAEFGMLDPVSEDKLDGVKSAAHIMGLLDHATETSILTSMDEVDPGLANKIRSLRSTYIDTLVTVYSKMGPEEAANLINAIDQSLALQIISRMKNGVAEKVLSQLDVEVAKVITEKLTLQTERFHPHPRTRPSVTPEIPTQTI
jgi:flagellar motor switch protein FliG